MTPDHRQNPKLLWGIAGGLVILVIAIFALMQFLASPAPSLDHQDDVLVAPVTQSASSAVATATQASSETEITTANILIESSILDEPVTENATLAKEELAKLDDIHVQLSEQEKTLQQQHIDADELTKLKEEQIKLLEAQLAAQ
jgi:hypothetical protein